MNYLGLILAGILYGGVVFGGKILDNWGASPFELLFYPNLIGASFILWFARKDLRKIVQLPLSLNAMLMLSVFLVSLGQFIPLFLDISVTLVLLLMYMQPVWTILIEKFYFRNDKDKFEWFAVIMMVIGLGFLINPWAEVDLRISIPGIVIALFGGFGLSVWIIASQSYTRRGISPAGTYWSTCAFVIPPGILLYTALLYLRPNELNLFFSFDLSEKLIWGFIIYAIFVYTLPNLLLYANNRDVSAVVVGMILLLEPVTGITLDVVFLHYPLTWNIIVGGLIILSVNTILVLRKK